MLKMITIFVFSLLVVSQYSAAILNKKTVSVFSEQYEEKYNMKIPPFELIPCEATDILKLEEMNLNIIKDNLIQSDNIRHISFRKNALTNISAIFLKRVQRLTCLDLSKNKINLYNRNFIEHSNLRVLILSSQNPELTNDGFKLKGKNLKTYKEHMELKIFDTTDIYLPNLEHLFLDNNDILSLQDTFNISFPKLSHIYLNNIKAININSDFFNKIPNTLHALHMENNKLSNLTLKNMAQITELYLDDNPLENIEIASKTLKILSLSHGAAMAKITLFTPNLEYLDLTYNNFYYESSIQYYDFQFLKTLLLDYNEFSKFPIFSFDLSLTKLSLSYNKLKYIFSEDFKHLKSLKMLSLRGNYIRNIENDVFKNLNHLEFLDLSKNQLVNLPTNWVVPLISLQFLNVSSNFFETISNMSISSFSLLTHLFAKDTFTSITTTELDNLPNSITVYLN